MVEIRYAGVVVGRSTVVRDVDERGVSLGLSDPMPVGTAVTLSVGDATADGVVDKITESSEVGKAGARIRFADPAVGAPLFGLNPPPGVARVAAPEAAAPAGTAAPTSELAAPPAPAPPAAVTEESADEAGEDEAAVADPRIPAPAGLTPDERRSSGGQASGSKKRRRKR